MYLPVLCGYNIRPNHMIAVGGAGSSGLPAFDSGTFIITKPERKKGKQRQSKLKNVQRGSRK